MSQKSIRPPGNGRSTDTIASFLLKTYEILEHPGYEKIISWDKDDIGFVVNDVLAFTRQILPKYFRHSNFSSFVRQLNMYDFHKVKQENENLVFKNPMFCRGEQQKLRFIKRKTARKVSNGLRRPNVSYRSNPENEKYANILKVLKKSIDNEISYSNSLLEKSLTFLRQGNESKYLELKSSKMKKNLITKIQDGLSQPKNENICDELLSLREECYRYFFRAEDWLNQNIQSQKKKGRVLSHYLNQMSIQRKQEDKADSEEQVKLEDRKEEPLSS